MSAAVDGKCDGLTTHRSLTQTYTYDSLHRRLSKTTRKDGIQKTWYFLYDGQNEIGSYDENGQIQELRILGHAPHAEIGAAVAIEINGQVYAPVHDLQGDIAVLVPIQSTESPTTYRYSAFREEKTTGPALSPWRYSSKRTDETGLVYYGRRYYTPDFGRWLTPDPAGLTDGMNLYAFLHNDLLIHLDEYGLLRIPLSAPSCESDHGKSLSAAYQIAKPYLTHPRIAGPIQALGGIGEAGFGAGMTYISGGLVAPAGWGIMAHGMDNFFTGMKTAITGKHYDTATSQLLQKTGLSAQTSNLVDMGLSLGGSMGGTAAIRSSQLAAIPQFALPPVNFTTGGAYNRAAFERHKIFLRSQMEKPHVIDPALFKLVNKIYRPNASIGSGSTAAAIRHEIETGEKIREKLHSLKGREMISAFNNWLKNHPSARPGDQAAAENIIKDLRNSLGE